ncbi:hypothetical protein GHT06_017067 [Daphnia sinensis]|uniref:Uncharacterized protein n=1 Tax=Daphnia sinensis TaxID=1820382 RepID=A0AAD5KQC3_9CRUS|nr:hypothetical protein GHT06_017067 [Daphnia sinensis]
MGVDSAGPGSPAKKGGQQTLVLEKLCQTGGCNKPVHATGRGNHHYCIECKIYGGSPTRSQKPITKKRGSSVLSPIEQPAKLAKDNENEFAINFKAAFDCDIGAFLTLDRESVIAKYKNHFFNVKERTEITKSDNRRLTDEINELRGKLNTAKLALADKDLKLFEMSHSNPIANVKHKINTPTPMPTNDPNLAGTQAGPAKTLATPTA